jgi:hypothetical protein
MAKVGAPHIFEGQANKVDVTPGPIYGACLLNKLVEAIENPGKSIHMQVFEWRSIWTHGKSRALHIFEGQANKVDVTPGPIYGAWLLRTNW